MDKKDNKIQKEEERDFPSVVSVLGHVDHGKTTLLDAIRKTNVATGEKGGITQKIGASQIEIIHENKKRKITFIDTPGHEAFENMRGQGVTASDIAILVVAANDGVMPQTKESIQKLLAAKIPYIVVFTKSDLPDIILDKVKQQLIKEGVALEGYSGDVPFVSVSAKTGDKIQDLLDLIILIYDLSQIKKSDKEDFSGVVIESKLDKKRGIIVTIIVKSGKLSVGNKLYVNGKDIGKARAIIDTYGKNVPFGYPGDASEIFGIRENTPAGTVIFNKEDKKVEIRAAENILPAQKAQFDLKSFLAGDNNKNLKLVIKASGESEIEAIKNALPEMVEVVFEGLGDISVSDVMLAKNFGAILIGFNNDINKDAKLLAETEHIFFRLYGIIYELLDEVEDALESLIREGQEVVLGKANILASFDHENVKIIGARVIEGKFNTGEKIRVLRGKNEIGKSYINSLRKGKIEVKEVLKGIECGIVLQPAVDFNIGDMLISYK